MRLAFSLMSWVANYKDVPQTFIAFRRLAQPHAGTSLPAGDEPRTRFICAIGGGSGRCACYPPIANWASVLRGDSNDHRAH